MHDKIELLIRLVQTDIDALHCYDQAIARVDEVSVAGVLRSFRADHDRHIDELSGAIRQLGGNPPRRQDASGQMLSGMTALASAVGTVSALGIMEANEIVTNQAYGEAVNADLPDSIWEVVARNRDDERRHIERIRDLLGQYGGRGRAVRGYAAMEGRAAALWMNTLRHHPWSLLLLAGAAGVVAATLWPRRQAIAAGIGRMSGEQRLAEEMAEPIDYPGYQAQPGEATGQPLH